jgi:sugar transferase (PEP-CTERM/EpsH1 system associated)
VARVKVLWVKSGGLLPLDTGGKIRSFNLLKEVAKKHDVTLFTFYAAQAADTHDDLKQYFSRVIHLPVVLPAQRGFGEALKYARNLLTRRPYSLSKYALPEVASALRKLLMEDRYDLLICDFLFSAPIVPWDIPLPKVLFTHNVETQIWKRHYEVARNPIWKGVAWREYHTMERAEREYLQKADHVLTVSESDSQQFGMFLPNEDMTVIPTGVDIDYFHPSSVPAESNSLVFTGSMDWMPNEDAILYFVKDIFPRIREEVPDASLCVVGRRPSERMRALGKENSGVFITGTVEDIRPFSWNASVYVVPLRVGGGTRIKIFEAMAMGKAIVSTPVGAEGLPVENDKHILLEESSKGFARQVIRLLREPDERAKLGREARKLVEENYSWGAVAGTFDAVFEKVSMLPGDLSHCQR